MQGKTDVTQTSAAARQDLDHGTDFDKAVDLDHLWSEEMMTRPRGRLRAYVPVIVGLVLGAGVGLGLGLTTPPEPAAIASLEIVPDPTLAGGVLDSNQANRFVQGEVLVLGGDDLEDRAKSAVPGARATEVTALQVGATDVVQLRVVSPTGTEAEAITQAMIDAYSLGRQQAYTRSIDASISVVNKQLKALPSASGSRAARERTSVEYSRLLALKNELQLNRSSAQLQQVPIVQRPRLDDQSRWPGAARNGFVGLVLGGLLGLLVKLVVDRRPRRVVRQPDWS